MQKFILIFIAVLCHTKVVECDEILPILFWHSAGESCCEAEFEQYARVIRKHLGSNVIIKSVQIGESPFLDRIRSLTRHPFDQIKLVCDELKNDTNFKNGYNGIGLSQGGLLIRGLAQTCEFPKMKNLISLGGPQNGIYQYPYCGQISPIMCSTLRIQMNILIYLRPFQDLLTPATYWHSLTEKQYRKSSSFLAILNNVNEINLPYISNLKALEKFILVKYEKDQSIIPNESTHFGYWDVRRKPIQLEETELYTQDRLGLKAMNENGQLIFLIAPNASHLEMNEEWLSKNVLIYLKKIK